MLAGGIFLALAASMLPGGAQSVIMPQVAAQVNGWAYYGLVFTVSTLATAIFTPLAGRLGERFGRRRLVLAGLCLCLLSNLMMPLCPTMELIVALRFFSGLGAALMTVPGLTLIGLIFPVEQRVKWMGYYGMLSSACNGFGPLLGGVCADTLGWQWVYFSSVPLACAGLFLLLAHPAAEDGPSSSKAGLDWQGLLLLAAGMVLLVLLCQGGGTAFPWLSLPALGLLLALAAAFAAFFLTERRQGLSALLPVSLFRIPVFSAAMCACFLTTLSAIAVFTYLALNLQSRMGFSAALSGIPVTAEFLTAMAVSPLLGRLMARSGRYRAVSVWAAVLIGGLSLCYAFLSAAPLWLIVALQILYGLAGAVVTSVYLMVVQSCLPTHLIGHATAGMQLGQTIGGTVGAAIFGAIVAGGAACSLPLVYCAAAGFAFLAVPASLLLPHKI